MAGRKLLADSPLQLICLPTEKFLLGLRFLIYYKIRKSRHDMIISEPSSASRLRCM